MGALAVPIAMIFAPFSITSAGALPSEPVFGERMVTPASMVSVAPFFTNTWHDIAIGDIAAVIVSEDVTEPQRPPPRAPFPDRNVQPSSQLLDLKPPL